MAARVALAERLALQVQQGTARLALEAL